PTHYLFEPGGDIGAPAHPRGRPPRPQPREPPVLDGRPDHRRPRPRPRDPHGLPALRRGQEAGPTSVRLLRAHGHRGERLPSRAGPRAVPARHVPRMQAGLPPRLRAVQKSALTMGPSIIITRARIAAAWRPRPPGNRQSRSPPPLPPTPSFSPTSTSPTPL